LAALADLITKFADKAFPPWTPKHERAFVGIKETLVGRECLTTIDFLKIPDYKIYVTTDASDTCSGAVLFFGPSWETARLVAFDSSTFKDAELNYPVHEKELLAVIRALKKWRSDLISSPFLFSLTTKLWRILITKRTFLASKPGGWNFSHSILPICLCEG
jgi:hypothetical protein